MKKEELLRQYKKRQNLFERLKLAGEVALKREITRHRLKIEDIDGRIKTFDKFRTKALRKEMSDPFKEMSDIVGLRVICLFQSDIDVVKDIIRQTFEVVKEDDKLIRTPINVFDYKKCVRLQRTAF